MISYKIWILSFPEEKKKGIFIGYVGPMFFMAKRNKCE